MYIKKNRMLHLAIKQYESQLKQKEQEILQLQQALQALSAEQARIQMQRQKRESIAGEVIFLRLSEVCDEYKKLGYSPICN